MKYKDWIETTEQLIANDDLRKKFEESSDYISAFQEWASKTFPEEYGND